MNRGYFLKTLWAILFIGASAQTNAALISRLGGLAYYDTVLDITWLADANAGAGSVFDDGASSTDGRMTWASANAWAASLNIGGITGWRLPATPISPLCTGVCVNSEMGAFFYNELGGISLTSILNSNDPDLALFSNIQSDNYWSTEIQQNAAMAFDFSVGTQNLASKSALFYFVWAVHSGDVGTTQVSEPGTIALIGLGLVGLLGFGRRLQKF